MPAGAKKGGSPFGPLAQLIGELHAADGEHQQAQHEAQSLMHSAALQRSQVLKAAQQQFGLGLLDQMFQAQQAQQEAQAKAQGEAQSAPTFQAQVPPGSPLAGGPVASKNPLSQGNQGNFQAALIGAQQGEGAGTALQGQAQAAAPGPGGGGGGTPSAAQGLPVAGDQIQTRQTRLGVSPVRESPFGFILLPEASQQTTSQPNALTARDIVDTRLQEAQNARQQAQAEAAAKAAGIRNGLEERRVQDQEKRTGNTAAHQSALEALDRARTDAYTKLTNAKAAALAAGKGITLTPGEKAGDQSYGRVYAQINQAGGFSQAEKNLGVLESVQKRLEAGENLSGGISRILPEGMRKQLGDQAAIDARQLIAGVVQQSSKQILGSQFTAKEAQDLVDRSFDPQLDPKLNAKRLGDFVAQSRAHLVESQREAQYFEENGTLKGFKRNVAPLSAGAKGTVPMVGPDGATYDIPADKAEAARAKGFK